MIYINIYEPIVLTYINIYIIKCFYIYTYIRITNHKYTTSYIPLDTLCEHILKRGVDTIRIDGKTPLVTRHALVKKFQTVPSCRVALLSIATAGTNIYLFIPVIHIYTHFFLHSSTSELKRNRIDINSRIDGFLC